MSRPIGFLLITHDNPAQARLLCERLSRLFESPPIVIHHDFGQCALDTKEFPPNVRFVANWNRTRWGGAGVVDGVLKSLRLLYQDEGPDWFVVLSGADYPIKPARKILADLSQGGFDAYIDHRRITRCDLPIPEGGWGNDNFIHPAWVHLAFERYMAIGFGFYKLATALHWRRKGIYLRSNFFISRFTPFDGSLHCHAGDFWFTANRKAARAMIEPNDANRRIIAHFRRRPNPDEGMFQTLLCNVAGLNISTDNKRFTDWHGCVNHPRMLGEEDFPALLASSDHFARKFTFNPEVLKKLDRMVDAQAEFFASESGSARRSTSEAVVEPARQPNPLGE